MGGNRVAPPRWFFNLFVTFLVSGLWHGAAWTYVIWGGLNGIYLIVGVLKDRWQARRGAVGATRPWRLARWQSVLMTFALTCFAWIFFRAESLGDAWLIVTRLPSGLAELPSQLGDRAFIRQYIMLGQGREDVLVVALALALLFAVELWQQRESVRERVATWHPVARYALYYAAIAGILLFGAFNQSQSFIYFQF